LRDTVEEVLVRGSDTPAVWAHRGARAAAPENTIQAFVLAAALGADGVELDARRTADGQLVLSHDATVPGLGTLCELTQAEIQRRRPDVPTLDDALDACAGMRVNIEIKNLAGDPDHDPTEHAAETVVAMLEERGRRDDVLVSSFSLPTIDRVRALDESVPTGFLTVIGFDPLEGVNVAADRGHGAAHPDARSLGGRIAAAVVEHARTRGVQVNVWTVNDPVEMRRLADAGVDGIITDVPDVARRVFDNT
jgi:glycerophosphoryl diester phosphodiesterase